MMNLTFREKALLAEKTAQAAGEMLERHGAVHVRRKAENDFVTEMDIKSENLIREMLLAACPEDAFFGEEGGGEITAQAAGSWTPSTVLPTSCGASGSTPSPSPTSMRANW